MVQPFSPLAPEPVLSGAYTWRSLIHHIRLMSLPITKKYMPENKGVPLRGGKEDRPFPGRALYSLLIRYSFLGSMSWERRSHLLTSNERHFAVLSHLIPSSVKLCEWVLLPHFADWETEAPRMKKLVRETHLVSSNSSPLILKHTCWGWEFFLIGRIWVYLYHFPSYGPYP